MITIRSDTALVGSWLPKGDLRRELRSQKFQGNNAPAFTILFSKCRWRAQNCKRNPVKAELQPTKKRQQQAPSTTGLLPRENQPTLHPKGLSAVALPKLSVSKNNLTPKNLCVSIYPFYPPSYGRSETICCWHCSFGTLNIFMSQTRSHIVAWNGRSCFPDEARGNLGVLSPNYCYSVKLPWSLVELSNCVLHRDDSHCGE